ncbi:MAG: redox-sensing transcriptional repressor Rex [Lachnospiraceae bacterium]|nr:redox-sensing transcriptional repressor Rex [Lachnospiraceae bacterium]
MNKSEISRSALGRIPLYISYIDSLPQEVETVSATKISRDLGLGEVQVRKDLAILCKNGRPKIGYNRKVLESSLKSFMTVKNGGAIIVGAGKMGKALLDYGGFETYGTKVMAAFDKNIDAPVNLPSGKSILPIESIKDFCGANDVKIGIITTPPESAQAVLNLLYECGIKLIWCFAPCRLYTPADMIIQYENLALSLAHLKLQNQSINETEALLWKEK